MTPRQKARAEGRKTYTSTKPCKRGHTGPRGVVDGSCYECARENSKTERGREYQKILRERHREAIKERSLVKNLSEERREKIRAYGKEYYQRTKNDPDRKAVRSRVSRNRSAKKAGAFGKESRIARDLCYELQEGLCISCRQPLTKGFHLDHIVPIARGGSNLLINFQCLCPFCNVSKKNKCPVEWANEINRHDLVSEFRDIVSFHEKLNGSFSE